MATTPKTVRTFTLDGTKKDFTIPFEYLARKFVVVTLIGATRRELILNTEYRFSTATTITTTKAWGPADNFDLIEIRRLTSATERLVDFADGSILRAYDLNISQVQSLHIAEEARDLTADTIGVNNDGDLDARARKIVNLADGVNDGDAVNMRQQRQWAGSALNQANRATTQADIATTQANAATQRAAAALVSQNAAEVSEANAKTSEAGATASRSAALDSRNAAAGSATAAAGSATSAAGSATSALVSQNAAKVSETNAKTSETNAKTSETNALASRSAAAGSATAAAGSATAAAGSATAALVSQNAAKVSETNAQTSETNAQTSRSAALASRNAAAGSATAAADSASASASSAATSKAEADRAKTEADKLGNYNGLAGALDNVSGVDVTWKGQQIATGKYQVRGDGDVTYQFSNLDGSNSIRWTRNAGGAMLLVDDRLSKIRINSDTVGNLSIPATMTANGNLRANGGVIGVRARLDTDDAGLWFEGLGSIRGVIYAGPDQVIRFRGGSANVGLTVNPNGDIGVGRNVALGDSYIDSTGNITSSIFAGGSLSAHIAKLSSVTPRRMVSVQVFTGSVGNDSVLTLSDDAFNYEFFWANYSPSPANKVMITGLRELANMEVNTTAYIPAGPNNYIQMRFTDTDPSQRRRLHIVSFAALSGFTNLYGMRYAAVT